MKHVKHILAVAAVALVAMLDCHGAGAQVNSVPALGNRDAAGSAFANVEGQKSSYFAGLGANTPAATPTDIAILTGATGKVIKITRVRISVQATAAGVVEYRLVLRSGGTQSAVNTAFANGTHSGPMDANDAASSVIAAGLAGVYTSNPASSGTVVGIVDDWTTGIAANSTAVFDFVCNRPAKCPTLRGPTQILAVNGNGHTLLTAEKFGIEFEWTEE